MARLRQGKSKITVGVDVDHPEQAVYGREIRWGMTVMMILFFCIFAFVGTGVMFSGIGTRSGRGGLIQSEFKNRILEYGITCLLINVPFGIVSFAAFSEPQPWSTYAALGSVNLVGLVFLGLFLRELYRRYFKYGKSQFRMDNFPGVIGGKCTGTVMVPKRFEALLGFEVNLQCIQLCGAGKGEGSHKEVKWETGIQTVQASNNFETTTTDIPLSFEVPFKWGCEPTNPKKSIYWALTVEANVEGIDYFEEFHLPFVGTKESKKGPETSLQDLKVW